MPPKLAINRRSHDAGLRQHSLSLMTLEVPDSPGASLSHPDLYETFMGWYVNRR